MSANTWHKDKKTWKQINEVLFKNQAMSDCVFSVEVENTKVKIPAHKYILGGFSPEFYNLFYLMQADSDEIPINDVSLESVTYFLEFVYTETITELLLEHLDDLLVLASRYSVESLTDFCIIFLSQFITVENVLFTMEKFSVYLDRPHFENECLKKLRKNRQIFEDPSFYEISNKTLTTILKSEELKGFEEITIFKGADKWSEKCCNKRNQEINSVNKRLALGPALKYIRFGAMTNDEFISCTSSLNNCFLTAPEIIKICHFILSNGQTECPYSGQKRQRAINMMCLFDTETLTIYDNTVITIRVDKPIKLLGFKMLGKLQRHGCEETEQFLIELSDERSNEILSEEIVNVFHNSSNQMYELFFKNSFILNRNTTYRILICRVTNSSQDLPCFITPRRNIKSIEVDDITFQINKTSGNFAAGVIFEEP